MHLLPAPPTPPPSATWSWPASGVHAGQAGFALCQIAREDPLLGLPADGWARRLGQPRGPDPDAHDLADGHTAWVFGDHTALIATPTRLYPTPVALERGTVSATILALRAAAALLAPSAPLPIATSRAQLPTHHLACWAPLLPPDPTSAPIQALGQALDTLCTGLVFPQVLPLVAGTHPPHEITLTIDSATIKGHGPRACTLDWGGRILPTLPRPLRHALVTWSQDLAQALFAGRLPGVAPENLLAQPYRMALGSPIPCVPSPTTLTTHRWKAGQVAATPSAHTVLAATTTIATLGVPTPHLPD